jgi:hypothetical protein
MCTYSLDPITLHSGYIGFRKRISFVLSLTLVQSMRDRRLQSLHPNHHQFLDDDLSLLIRIFKELKPNSSKELRVES